MRFKRAFSYRACIIVAATVGLMAAVPAGQESPPGGSRFPLAALWDLVSTRPLWAFDRPVTPAQERGGGHGDGAVSTSDTTANGGQGRAPGRTQGALDAAQPLGRQGRADWTAPERKGFNAATSRRIAGESTAMSDMYANADGSHTRIVSSAPVNYRAGDGSWQAIDSRLVRDGSGRWRAAANSLQISVAGISTAQRRLGVERGQAQLSRVVFAPGQSVGWTLSGASLPDPVVSGTSATYADVLPSTDVVLDVFHSGVKETLVLHSPDAPSSWLFELNLQGLTPVLDDAGGVSLRDGSGATVARIPAGYMEDSNVHPQSGEGAVSRGVSYELTSVDGRPALRVTADKAWLADPGRKWPVKMDPATVMVNTTTYVQSNISNSDVSGETQLKSGESPDVNNLFAWSLFKFPDFSSTYLGQRMTLAQFQFRVFWSGNCGQWANVGIWETTSAWSPNTVRYASAPSLGREMGRASFDPISTVCTNNDDPNGSNNEWWGIWFNDDGVRVLNDWTGGSPNHGFALKTDPDHPGDWIKMSSVNTNYAPRMEIHYTPNVAPVVSGQYPTHGYASPTLTPELRAVASDPDGYPKGLTYQFLVFDPSSATPTTPIVDTGMTGSPSYTVPEGRLSWSKAYSWTVLVSDGNAVSSTQTMNVLSTTVPQAPITSGLSQNPDKGFSPQLGNYTTSAVDAQVPGVGPALAISRSYNSRDGRVGQAFGPGWSSILDAKATEVTDPGAAAPRAVTITYPTGQDVTFGRNSDGTFTPPAGRFSTLRVVTGGGYELVDKEGTKYTFTVVKAAGVFGLTGVADAAGRALTLTYTSGKVTQLTGASGRRLNLTWTGSNVATVANEAGDLWGYTYTSGLLTKVCPPTSTSACHAYEYGNNSLHPTAVLDAQPHTYWRLNEPVGSLTAQSSVVDNADTATGTYANVTLGVAGPLPGATGWTPPTAAGFNGTNSYVNFSQPKVAMKRSVQSVSLWFKTAAPGVLLSYQDKPVTDTSATLWCPALYIGVDGKLRGQFWPGSGSPITTSATVTNNAWHHVVLASSGAQQQMWLDGALVGTAIGPADISWANNMHLGAGKWDLWPSTSGVIGYFNGSIAEFAFYDRPLTGVQAASMWSAGTTVAKPMTKVKRPSGGVNALVEYDAVSGIVKKLTDRNNGVWTINPPVIGGTSAVHTSAVLAAAPADYFRLVDTKNEVNGVTGTFSGVTFSDTNTGPLGDRAASFAGGSGSHMTGNGSSIDTSNSYSVSAWVYMTAKTWNQQVVAVEGNQFVPFLFGYAAGSSDRWRMWVCNSDAAGLSCPGATSTTVPALNTWTHLAATVEASSRTVKLYVNGQLESTATVPALWKATGPLTLGRVKWSGGYSDHWPGRLAEVATYQRVLSPEQVRAQFEARDKAANGGAGAGVPVKTVVVTDPGTKNTSYVYDLSTGRQVRQIDARGGVTAYGYDAGGFLHTTTDPNGNMTVEEHDVRGNVIAKTTCQDRSENKCSTVYMTYFPDATSKVLTPDPRNDVPLTVRDGRSSSSTDNAFLTTSEYDAQGNLRSVTDPLGRVTRTDYSMSGKHIPHDVTGLNGSGRYVRVRGTQRGYPHAGYSLWDLEVYGPTGGDLAADRPATASTVENSATPASHAVDANPLTRWSSAQQTASESIYVDLGATKTISRVRLTWETAYASGYEIEVSPDAVNWTTLRTVSGQSGTPMPAGLPLRRVSPGGGLERTWYAASGDVVRNIDASGLDVMFEYDNLGRVSKRIVKSELGDLTTAHVYDGLNRLRTQTDPAATNRVTGATHTAVTTTTYDDDGNVLTQTVADTTGGDAPRTVENTYNARGQLESTKDALGKIRSFTHDAYGNKIAEVDPTGARLEYTYDAAGQLVTTKVIGWTGDPNNPSAPADLIMESREYDPAGRLGTVTDAMGWQTLYTYTDNGLTATVTRKNPVTSATFQAESNVYDAAGHLVRKVTDNGTNTTEFAVDAAGRTTSQTSDPAGVNRKTELTYDLDDHVVSTVQSQGGVAKSRADTAYDPLGRTLATTGYLSTGLTPVGRWKLNETAGSTAAASSGNLAGETANVTWANDATRGPVATFNGTSSGVFVPGPVADTTRAFSLSAWVKLTAKTTDRYVATMPGVVGGSTLKLHYDVETDKWQLAMSGRRTDQTVGWVHLTSPGSAALNVWTHLAVTVDPATNTVSLYVDGTLAMAAAAPMPLNNRSTALHIGKEYDLYWFAGSISDVQAYQHALSGAEVTQVKNGTAPAMDAKVVRTSQVLNKRGFACTTTDPNGATTTIDYDAAGQATVVTSPTVSVEESGGTPVAAAAVNTVGYNTFGEAVENKDAKGRVTTTVRDAEGRTREVRLPAYTPPGSSTPINAVVKTEYDNAGQVSKTIDPLLHETTYLYDQLGRLARTTAPNLGETKYAYTLNGERLSVTDANGARSEATYDYLGRTVTTTAIERSPAQAYVTTHAYNAAGRLHTVTPPGRSAVTYEYNAVGESTRVVDGAGNAVRFEYDFAGRRTATIAADNSQQTVTYDSLGRPVAQQQFSSAGAVLTTRSATFDAAGRTLTTTDPRGNATSFAYDATGMVTQMVEPVSATESITTSFGYDIAGRPTRFTDGRGNRFLTTYNSWGKPESEIEPGGATFTVAYDAAGRPVSQASPGGVTVTNAYNSMGQLISQVGTGADAPTAGRVFDYDLGGRMTSFAEGSAASTLSYNDRGLLASVTGAAGASSFGWTGDGLMASRQDASGTTSYGYDGAGRLSTVSDGSTGQQATYAYNTLSQVTSITYGASGNKRSFTYDALHRLESDSLARPDGATIGSITYGYDLNGNETSKTTVGFAGAGSNTYTYDYANRLLSWNSTTFAYDKSGNRTQAGTRVFTYNERNQLTSDGTATYSYTARGTLSGTTVGTVTAPSTFDAYGQQITQDTRTYAYDGLGRVLTAGATAFTYSGVGNHVASDGTATYSRDPSGDLFGVKAGASGVFAWTDLHDDVVGQFTSTGTSLTGSRTYNPFGTVLATAGITGNLGYQSGWTDPSTSRVNMHARWYNPDTAQFASRDTVSVSPVPSSIRANRYAYGDGNPMTVTDPTGHFGSWLKSKVSSAVSKVTSAVSSAWNSVSSTVSSWASSAYSWARDKFDQARNWVSDKVNQVRNWVGDKVRSAKNWAVQKFNQAKESVKQTYNQAKQAVIEGAKRAAEVTRAAAKAVAEAGKKYIEAHVQAVKDAFEKTKNWIEEHKAEIVGFVVGAVVGIGCGALIGWTGVGAVACGALAGAAGSLVTGLMKGKSGWDLVGDVALGAAGGALFGGLGSMVGAGIGAGVRGLIGGGLKTAASKFGGAFKAEAANIVGGFRNAANTVAGGVRNAANAVSSGARNAWNSATTSLREAGEGIASRVRNAFGRSGCPTHSFNPKTPVLMASGQTVAIKDIKVGDKVLATDPATGRTEAKPVTALHVNRDTDLTDLTIRDAKTGRTTVLKTTQHHPFWDAARKEWVDAGKLRADASTLIDAQGATSTVVGVRNHIGAETMHDLTVDDIHTYYVVPDNAPVLVHNCDVYHATTSPGAAAGVLRGIDPAFLNPNSRFGAAFYVTDDVDTALAELAHHGATPTNLIRFEFDASAAKVLDLTNPVTAWAWKYTGGPISRATQSIGATARAVGYNAIKFPSLRGPGTNWAILDDFNDILKPQMVTPI